MPAPSSLAVEAVGQCMTWADLDLVDLAAGHTQHDGSLPPTEREEEYLGGQTRCERVRVRVKAEQILIA